MEIILSQCVDVFLITKKSILTVCNLSPLNRSRTLTVSSPCGFWKTQLSWFRHVRKCWLISTPSAKKDWPSRRLQNILFYCFLSSIETVVRKERKLPAVVELNVPPSCLVFMKRMTSHSLPRKSGAILKTLSGRGSRLFPLPIFPRAPVFSLQRSRFPSFFFHWCILTGASAKERDLALCLQFLSSSSQPLVLKISQTVGFIREALTPKYRDETK